MIVVANYEHRLLAFLVDLILSFLVCVALFVFIPLLRNYSYIIELFTIILFFILGIYVILSYICFSGVTLGGLLLNVRIIGKDNKPLTFKSAFIKGLLLSLFILSLYNVVYMLIKRTSISFFDEASNTKAIKIKNVE